MNPAAVISSLVKIDGMQTASKQLREFDNMNKKASGSADKLSSAAKRQGSAGTQAGSGLKTAAKATAGFIGALGAYRIVKDSVDSTEQFYKATMQLSKNFGLSTKTASEWGAVMQARGVDANRLTLTFKTLSMQVRAASQGSKQSAATFQALGISQQELVKHGNDLDWVMARVSDGLAKMPAGTNRAAIMGKLFGRTWQTISPIIRDGSDAMEKQLHVADKYGATLSGSSQSMDQMIAKQREFKIATLGLQITLGNVLIPIIRIVQSVILDIVSTFRNAGPEVKLVAEAFLGLAAAWAIVNKIMGMSSPISQVITIIGLLAIALITAYKESSTFRNIVNSAWQSVLNVANAVFPTLKEVVLTVFNALVWATNHLLIPAFMGIKTFVQNVLVPIWTTEFAIMKAIVEATFLAVRWAWNNILSPVFTAIKAVLVNVLIPIWIAQFNIMKAVVSTVFTSIKALWNTILSPVFTAIGWVAAHTVVPIVTTAFNNVKSIVSAVFTAVQAVWNSVLKPTFNAIATAAHALGSTFTSVFNSIKNAIVNTFNTVKNFVTEMFNPFWVAARNLGKAISNPFIRAMNWILQKGWDFIHAVVDVINAIPIIPDIKISARAPVQIPEFARGGTMPSTGLAVVGERGPELAALPVGTRVFSNRDSAKMMGLPHFAAGGVYTKADLVKLWSAVNPGLGDPNLMAAIAMAESGGRADVVNSIGATGLWQIHPGGAAFLDPIANAREAGNKLRTQGLKAWEAFTNGSYKQFMGDGGGGGVLGVIGGFLGDLLSGGVDALKSALPDIPSAPDWMPGVLKNVASGIPRYILDQTIGWFGKQLGGLFDGGGGTTGAGNPTWQAVGALASNLGLTMTSGYREGDPGYHGMNRAKDYSNGYATPQELTFARTLASQFGSHLLELIHTPLGWGIKNGRQVPLSFWGAATDAAHFNHVHVAFANGGVWPGGWGLVGERGPELANLPSGTRVHSTRQSENMLRGDSPLINIENLNVADSFDERALVHRLAFLLEM